MKHTAPELEALRAQMRELRQSCEDLESRLCDLEDEDNPFGRVAVLLVHPGLAKRARTFSLVSVWQADAPRRSPPSPTKWT